MDPQPLCLQSSLLRCTPLGEPAGALDLEFPNQPQTGPGLQIWGCWGTEGRVVGTGLIHPKPPRGPGKPLISCVCWWDCGLFEGSGHEGMVPPQAWPGGVPPPPPMEKYMVVCKGVARPWACRPEDVDMVALPPSQAVAAAPYWDIRNGLVTLLFTDLSRGRSHGREPFFFEDTGSKRPVHYPNQWCPRASRALHGRQVQTRTAR